MSELQKALALDLEEQMTKPVGLNPNRHAANQYGSTLPAPKARELIDRVIATFEDHIKTLKMLRDNL